MPTVSINLPPDLNSLVEREVTAGQFHSAEAVVCEGLRLLQEREQLGRPDFEVSTLAELKAKRLAGLEHLERGKGIPGGDGFWQARERFQAPRSHV